MESGIYHKHNFLKFRLMEVCVQIDRQPITTREWSILLNVPINSIESALCYYEKKGIPYFRRLPKKDGNKYRYKLTDKGFKAYLIYRERILKGFDLN